MKKCSKCGVEKQLEQFHRKAESRDGRRADCAACATARTLVRQKSPEGQARRKAYQQTEKYKEIKKAYATSDRGRELARQYGKGNWQRKDEDAKERHREYCRKWRKTPLGKAARDADRARIVSAGRHKVYRAVHSAIRAGALTKRPCEVCGSTAAQAHHEDYSKPLEVRWLCPKDHAAEHRRQA